MKIAIAYASLSGNTTAVAREIEKHLLKNNHQVEMFSLLETQADSLKDYDLVFMGSSTYDEGLNPIAAIFFDLARINGHTCDHAGFAVFTLGDSTYPEFATSGKLAKKQLETLGAQIVEPILVIDGKPTSKDLERSRKWVNGILGEIALQPFKG